MKKIEIHCSLYRQVHEGVWHDGGDAVHVVDILLGQLSVL